MPDREAIRDNARYLREVRPIDPEEIADYVPDGEHPAVVRRVLREEALDLGLVEREDGRFVPAPEGPVEPRGGVDRLHEDHVRRLEDALVERFGTDWHRGESGDRLRDRIRKMKEDYYRGNPVEYDETAALGYAIYHLPDTYAAAWYVFDELAREGLVERPLRVLDVGAGVGGPALALADFLPEDSLVEYHAVEPSAAADLLEGNLAATGRNFHSVIHRQRAEEFDPDGEYDLMVFANVLSELDDPVDVVGRYLDALAEDGTVAAIAPADRETSIGLREVERAVPATVYGPTVRLWPNEDPSDDLWSFRVEPDLDVPAVQRKLDEAGPGDGEFVNVTVQFSHSILRVDGRRRHDVTADAGRFARMADSEDHVTDRVNYLAAKLSASLAEGDNPLYRVSDGSESAGHFAVLTRETALNRPLREAGYGDLLSIEGALVLWNDDERAYNLVVDEETVVDRVG